jgi:UDP-glucose 4-epimerase
LLNALLQEAGRVIHYRRALVTGGAGFIGSHVVSGLLGAGIDVVVLDNLSTGYIENLQGLDVTFIRGDVRNAAQVAEAIEGCEVVFHIAASVGHRRSIDNPTLDVETNVLGTLNVLEAARRAGLRKIVYSSSAAIFAPAVKLPVNEGHLQAPETPYGISKLAGEHLCLAYSRLHGLEAVCLRYFNVYGTNQRFDPYGNVIPIFVERLLESMPLVVYGDGEQTRDFVNAADVARANILAAGAPVSGTFNIGTGESISIKQLIGLLCRASGRTVKVEYQPPRPGEVRHASADISKAAHVLHYAPTIEFARGLRDYISWFQSKSGQVLIS